MFINEAEDIGNIACRYFRIECLLQRFVPIGFGPMPRKGFLDRVEFQMFEFPQT